MCLNDVRIAEPLYFYAEVMYRSMTKIITILKRLDRLHCESLTES